MTMVIVAALLCAKLGGQRPASAAGPPAGARALAVRELLTAKQSAMAAKTAKLSAAHAAAQAALASKHSALIKGGQKLEEAAPAEEAAAAEPAAEEPAAEEDAAPAAEDASAPPPPAVADAGAGQGGDKDTFGNRYPKDDMQPGWYKAGWSSGDWASWVITGPLITVAFSFFMFYTYGVPAGALTMIICAFIDVGTFYYNW